MEKIHEIAILKIMEESSEKNRTLYISVHEDITVSDEWFIVGLIIQRVTTWRPNSKSGETLVSVAEYRQLLGDSTSTDEQIVKRLKYLEAFCKNIIKPELQIYDNQSKK
jgi:hypothetical protein